MTRDEYYGPGVAKNLIDVRSPSAVAVAVAVPVPTQESSLGGTQPAAATIPAMRSSQLLEPTNQ
jgi:hypothetical protein